MSTGEEARAFPQVGNVFSKLATWINEFNPDVKEVGPSSLKINSFKGSCFGR